MSKPVLVEPVPAWRDHFVNHPHAYFTNQLGKSRPVNNSSSPNTTAMMARVDCRVVKYVKLANTTMTAPDIEIISRRPMLSRA
jgi:hypothetical protein